MWVWVWGGYHRRAEVGVDLCRKASVGRRARVCRRQGRRDLADSMEGAMDTHTH